MSNFIVIKEKICNKKKKNENKKRKKTENKKIKNKKSEMSECITKKK